MPPREEARDQREGFVSLEGIDQSQFPVGDDHLWERERLLRQELSQRSQSPRILLLSLGIYEGGGDRKRLSEGLDTAKVEQREAESIGFVDTVGDDHVGCGAINRHCTRPLSSSQISIEVLGRIIELLSSHHQISGENEAT